MGRSCIELQTDTDRYLLDCGIKFRKDGVDYPEKVFEPRTIQAVFLSHAHLDHSGGLPFFEHYRLACPIFCTEETRDLLAILLKDSERIARIKHLCQPYNRFDVKKAMRDLKLVEYNVERRFRTIKYTYYNSGHIPGSASVKVEAEGISVVYTGDYKTTDTALMRAAKPDEWGNVDVLITEATYGDKNDVNRDTEVRDFLSKIDEVLQRGGSVLVPVFAIGRAQEVLLILAQRRWKVPVYLDGMASRATRVIMDGSSFSTRQKDRLQEMYRSVKVMNAKQCRECAADKPGIIVTTSGMLQGGPAILYMEQMYNDPKNAVLLTGYQVKNTVGWYLANENKFYHNGEQFPVQCEVKHYNFSAHLNSDDIHSTILAVKPKILILNHGNKDAVGALAEWAQQNSPCKVYAVKIGEMLEISQQGDVSTSQAYPGEPGKEELNAHQYGEYCDPADVFETED